MRIRPGTNKDLKFAGSDGFASVYLKTKNGEVSISKGVTMADVQSSNLDFTFEAVLWYPADEKNTTLALGHEALLHLNNYVKDVTAFLSTVDKNRLGDEKYATEVADKINTIYGGNKHHDSFAVEGNYAKEFYDYLKELGSKYNNLKDVINAYKKDFKKEYSKK